MSQLVVGKDLPNLKICVDNAVSVEKEQSTEMEVENNDDSNSEDNSLNTGKNLAEVKVNLNWKSVGIPVHQPKRYENKYAFFVAELKMTAEELQNKLEERAERFGQQVKPRRHVGQDEIDAVYKSINLDLENLKSSSDEKGIRLEALHVHGVDEMSTNDIFDYFKDTTPAWIEWVNDVSCNVVWLEELGAVGALLKLSRPISLKEKSEIDTEDKAHLGGLSDSVPVVFSADEFIKPDLPADDAPSSDLDVEMGDGKADENKDVSKEVSSIALPPGHWRLGMSHPKAKHLLLRFATKDDKKIPGAEKHSDYYKKHGNPNYGGMKGLISKTRKRKFRFFKEQEELKVLLNRQKVSSDSPTTVDSEVNKSDDYDDGEEDRKERREESVKRPRMRMHADDEESNQRKKNGVHERLGKRSEEASAIGSSDSEVDDLEDSNIIGPEVYRQSSVWDRLEGFPSVRPSYRRTGDRQDLRHHLQDSTQINVRSRPSGADLRSKLQRLRQDKDEPETKHRSPMLIKPYQESK